MWPLSLNKKWKSKVKNKLKGEEVIVSLLLHHTMPINIFFGVHLLF